MAFCIILKQFQNKCERLKQTQADKSDTENGKCFAFCAFVGWICIWLKAGELCELENKWKWRKNSQEREKKQLWQHSKTNGKWRERKKQLPREWIERQGATARTMSTFSFIASLVAKLVRKVVRFSSFYVITLRLVIFSLLFFYLCDIRFLFFILHSFVCCLLLYLLWNFYFLFFVMRIPFGHSMFLFFLLLTHSNSMSWDMRDGKSCLAFMLAAFSHLCRCSLKGAEIS